MKDSITASVDIHASLERVWSLVSEPGWWINAGDLVAHEIVRTDDEAIVTDPRYGDFPVGIVAIEPPTRAVYTWHPGGNDVPRTTIELTLTELSPGHVRVDVVESGFAALTPEQHAANYGENVEGWGTELAALARVAEGGADAGASSAPTSPGEPA